MPPIAWCLLLSVAPGVAGGTELFRCVAADGAVAYQDTPCDPGSRLTNTIVVPEARVEARRASPSKPAKAKSPKAARASSKPRADKRNRQREACAAARAEEQRVLDGLGLARTFDQLRTLGDKVQAACKGL